MTAPVAHFRANPTRAAIADEVIAILANAERPLTLADLYAACETVEYSKDLSAALSRMRSEGRIENGPEVQPGMPGGMTGKGARAVASYRLTPLNLAADREADRSAPAPITESETLALIAAIEADVDVSAGAPETLSGARLMDQIMTLLEGHDELMMLYADQQLEGDPIWSLMKAQRTAMMTFL